MKDNLGVVLGSSAVSLCAGIILASGGFTGGWGRNLSLMGLGALPVGFIAHLVVDTRAARKVNEAEDLLNNSRNELAEIKRLYSACEKNLTKSIDELKTQKQQNTQVSSELEKLQRIGVVIQRDRDTALAKVEQLQKAVSALNTRVEQLQQSDEEWKRDFETLVDEKAHQLFDEAKSKEIQKIFDEHDEITREAMALFRELQQWGVKVAHGHESKREIIKSMAAGYNSTLDELNGSVNKERESLLEQIELLNERVAILQRQLTGDLTEPQYGDFGFNDSGSVANAIANWLWANRKIALKVTGFDESQNGVATAGYMYSRSIAPEQLIRVIDQSSKEMCRTLGIYAIQSAKKLAITDCITVEFRRNRPTRKSDKGSLYRSKEDFINYILSQPVRLRIVGEPGSGKSPTSLVLMSHLLKRGFLNGNTPNGRKLPHTIIEFCNPLSGVSVKNSDDLDFCLRWSDAKSGFKGLADEYKFRKSEENANYKNSVGCVWVCDEFDIAVEQVGSDGAKQFKQVLKDGGHINLGVLIMGQSGMVSTTKGLSIDDQKMLTNIYIDPVSIRTFLTQYGDRFYSQTAVAKALATLEQLELEIEEQNEIVCDTAREFRVAMVVADRSPVFYQLPYFDSAEVDLESYEKTVADVGVIRVASSNNQQQAIAETPINQGVASNGCFPYVGIRCSCGSSNIKKNGKAGNKQKYRCNDCGKSFTDGE